MNSMMNLSFFLMLTFIMASLTLSIQFSHFLMSLFCLEAMMLSSMMLITLSSCLNASFMPHLAMILLTLGACEASIGLSMMVSMSRMKGSDMMNTMTMNKC